MSNPPELLPFRSDWSAYEDQIYEAFLDSFVRANILFNGMPVRAQYRPETRGKGYSFCIRFQKLQKDKTVMKKTVFQTCGDVNGFFGFVGS